MISPAVLRRYLGESESGHRGETTRPESQVEIAATRAARVHAMRGCRLHRARASGVQRPRGAADTARRAGAGSGRTRSEQAVRGTCRSTADALVGARRFPRRGRRARARLHDRYDHVLSGQASGWSGGQASQCGGGRTLRAVARRRDRDPRSAAHHSHRFAGARAISPRTASRRRDRRCIHSGRDADFRDATGCTGPRATAPSVGSEPVAQRPSASCAAGSCDRDLAPAGHVGGPGSLSRPTAGRLSRGISDAIIGSRTFCCDGEKGCANVVCGVVRAHL
jgi:hypothetical protein